MTVKTAENREPNTKELLVAQQKFKCSHFVASIEREKRKFKQEHDEKQ